MKNKIKILLSVALLLPVFFFSGCTSKNTGYLVNLEIWGLFDDSKAYEEIITEYKKINPYVGEIKYRKFTPETYKRDLIDAMASGQGPDIFLIQNTWTPSFGTKIEPAPENILRDSDIRSGFVDVVFNDFVNQEKVYGVPLSVDSLALYYNRDMFNAAGITSPPKTWEEFNEAVRKLTKLDSQGEIVQAGAALGTALNINRSTDILNLLMLQNGVQMTNSQNTKATINVGVVGSDGNVVKSGENSLGYYAQFANVRSPFYTWNNKQHNSIDAFSEGGVAMMLNYSWQREAIMNKNGKLNFGIAPVPQFNETKPINYANYWGYAVAKNKNSTVIVEGQTIQVPNQARVHEAWQFLKFLTMKNNGVFKLTNIKSGTSKDFPVAIDPAIVYLKETEKPAARRDIIELQKNDSIISPYAYGNLIAKSWFQADPDGVEKVLAEAIESLNRGNTSLYDALSTATNRIDDLMRR
ncbi:MAG TPA: hypothetical protein DCX32_03745 [Candidatus Moranbacteria bacterium]|nr:MAG: hypothetical protein UW87_C0025G0003 [Candidatus Moranbacteria bacterium GW2011_GWC2_45_10]KKT94738.1 MAG: hypothetical protein UW95_C0009G0005 [Parcubacteria group bacterium GW2011_GWC1_45_14]HAV11627.1 hypothetical protein [Candidatus Moranbacteria bacterium]